jgi:hypothetical protein
MKSGALEEIDEAATETHQTRTDAKFLNYFDTKCVKSKALIEDAKQIIPGGVQHNLAFNYPFPLAIEKACGAHMWDVDGNRYIDFLQAGGPTVLGSNYAPVRKSPQPARLGRSRACSTVQLKLAQLIQRYMPSIEMFRIEAPHGSVMTPPGGAHVHEKEICHQGWRRVSRLERSDGVRSAHPGTAAKPPAFRAARPTRKYSRRLRAATAADAQSGARGTAAVIVSRWGQKWHSTSATITPSGA